MQPQPKSFFSISNKETFSHFIILEILREKHLNLYQFFVFMFFIYHLSHSFFPLCSPNKIILCTQSHFYLMPSQHFGVQFMLVFMVVHGQVAQKSVVLCAPFLQQALKGQSQCSVYLYIILQAVFWGRFQKLASLFILDYLILVDLEESSQVSENGLALKSVPVFVRLTRDYNHINFLIYHND